MTNEKKIRLELTEEELQTLKDALDYATLYGFENIREQKRLDHEGIADYYREKISQFDEFWKLIPNEEK